MTNVNTHIQSPSSGILSSNSINRLSTSPILAWWNTALCVSAFPLSLRRSLAVPSYLQLCWFASVFGGTGYLINKGEVDYGTSICTAWSLTYLTFHLKKPFKCHSSLLAKSLPLSIGTQALAYGYHVWRESNSIDEED